MKVFYRHNIIFIILIVSVISAGIFIWYKNDIYASHCSQSGPTVQQLSCSSVQVSGSVSCPSTNVRSVSIDIEGDGGGECNASASSPGAAASCTAIGSYDPNGADNGTKNVYLVFNDDHGATVRTTTFEVNCAVYTQPSYYSESGYYSQGGYYNQGSYEGGFYSQGTYYSQGAYYSQALYYSQAAYYSEGAYAPSAPSVSGVPPCATGPYNVTISWTGPPHPVFNFYAKIDDDGGGDFLYPNDFYNKHVPSGTSTAAPAGFTLYDSGAGPLTLNPGVSYYTRAYNGLYGPTTSFSSPTCTLAVNVSAIPSSGVPPMVSTISAGLSGTYTGTPEYQFDCGNGTVSAWQAGPTFNCTYNTGSFQPNVSVRTSTGVGPVNDPTPPTVTVVAPPILDPVIAVMPNYCSAGPGATISWTIASGGPQFSYHVQIDDDPAFGSPVVDTGPVTSTSNTYATPVGAPLLLNTTYRARVRVWNTAGTPSVWTNMNSCNDSNIPNRCNGNSSWTTPIYPYPDVDFTWSPPRPSRGVQIQFTDTTVFNGPSTGRTWLWNFGDGTDSTVPNPVESYSTFATYQVSLTARDAAGQSCTTTPPASITIQKPIPEWKETIPR